MRYKLTLAYNGAAFCGWQIQPDDPTVQGVLQDALKTLLGSAVEVVGAGRTDTGVHASFYVAHFDYDATVDVRQLCYRLNAILPKDIAIFSVEPVSDSFHARFSARRRKYQYFIHREKNPFLNDFSWYCRFNLDVDKMNRACEYLVGTHDCHCFEKTGSVTPSPVCEIYEASWTVNDSEHGAGSLTFTIEANRFLRNMVRAIVGTMVDIGRGKHEPEYILVLLEKGTRSDAGQSVPGHALFLTDIKYL